LNCGNVVQELRKYIPEYEKSERYLKRNSIYKILINEGNPQMAINSSIRLCEERVSKQNPMSPYCQFHQLHSELKRT
ncbi:MAG: hypothetical protein AAGI38_16700, partial [Bacteroidota bacterium]